MLHLAQVIWALVLASAISDSYCYGASDSMYEQIAKALWQLQMKGDINKALQNTEIWNRPIQNNPPGGLPVGSNRPRNGLVVRELILNDNVSPPHIRVRTTNGPALMLGPNHAQPSTAKEKQTAFARRVTERQVTLHPPTTSQTEGATIAPERVYSNKMNRNTAKGYGSSLTKLIANKIKFDPAPQPAIPSNSVIDSILGPLDQQGGNPLPSNFLPLPSTASVSVPNTASSQKTTVQMKEKQRTVLAKPVKSTPIVVFQGNGEQQVPSPSFSIVAPNLGQNPASFRLSNKEVSSNQLQDKNNREHNSGFDNFKDMELNDVSQVVVDQATSVKPDGVKKPAIVEVHEQGKESSHVDPKTVIKPPQPAVDNTESVDNSVKGQHEKTWTKSGDIPRTMTKKILTTKPDQVHQEKHKETSNKVEVSRSDVAIDNTPSNNQRVWQEAKIINSEIQRPEVQVVQSSLPALIPTSEDVHTTLQTFDTTDLPIQEDIDLTTEVPTQGPTTTTKAPVRVSSSRGSPRGSRPRPGGSFTGVRPSARGTRPIGRGTRPVGRGTPSVGRGTPSAGRGTPSVGRGTPSVGRGTPSVGRGTPSVGRGTPSVGRGTPSVGRGTPSVGRGTPSVGRGTPSVGRGTPSVGRGTPSVGRGTPLVGRGTPSVGIGSAFPSRGSPRGGPSNGVRRQETVVSVNTPEVKQTTIQTTTTQATETEPTTTEQTRGIPVMNTAQFARRARPSRVVVNTLGNAKQRPAVARGVGQIRAQDVQPVRVPVPSEMLSFDRPSAVEQQARDVQIPLVLNSAPVEQHEIPLVLNSEGATDRDLTLADSISTSATTTEQQLTTAAPATTSPTTPSPTTTTTRRASARRPGMMSPEEKRLAQRNFQG